MYDLKITYSPVGFNPPQVETIPKVRAYSINEHTKMLNIDLSMTQTVFIPVDRIQKVEVLG